MHDVKTIAKRSIDSINKRLRESVNESEIPRISFDKIEEELLTYLQKMDVKYYKLPLSRYVEQRELIFEKVKAVEMEAISLHSDVLPLYFYMEENGYAYNYDVQDIKLRGVKYDDMIKRIQLMDGLILYEEILWEREEFIDLLQKYYDALELVFRVSIRYDKNKCLIINRL